MEEIINKPDNQFKDILNDLIDYSKDSEEKSALIKEVCLERHTNKPAASLNSSIYSSAASSSSSTSSASDSSTNSASSSSTSSTLSSPSQSNQGDNDAKTKRNSNVNHDMDNIEVAKMEDLGKTARILEHRLAISSELKTAINGVGKIVQTSSHSDNRSSSLNIRSSLPSCSLPLALNAGHHPTQQPWKTISGKRDKRRKKPIEQPVLSQHIPGHKGEQEVEWLVKFIESGAPGTTNMSSGSNKKIAKNTKQQSKRLPNQTMELERENLQRKPNNKPTSSQGKPLQQVKQPTGSDQIAPTTQSQHLNQRKQAISDDSQNIEAKQQSKQGPTTAALNEIREPNNRSKIKRSQDLQKQRQQKQDEAVVTFADHIRVNDDEDSINSKYIFGFFEEQKQQPNNSARLNRSQMKPSEDTLNNSKSNQAGQKHKLKNPRVSPNSEQKRYKFNDNIDVNSFNYHQVLEFISSSWENTAKSHRIKVKCTGSSWA